MMRVISLADLVTLKSHSSNEMIVRAFSEDRKKVCCVWLNENKERQKGWFDIEALEHMELPLGSSLKGWSLEWAKASDETKILMLNEHEK